MQAKSNSELLEEFADAAYDYAEVPSTEHYKRYRDLKDEILLRMEHF